AWGPACAAATGVRPGDGGRDLDPPLVPEVAELEGDPEILLLQRLDRGLQVVALLGRHPQLLALDLGLHALDAEGLDELVDGGGLVPIDAGHQRDVLAGRAAGRAPALLVVAG